MPFKQSFLNFIPNPTSLLIRPKSNTLHAPLTQISHLHKSKLAKPLIILKILGSPPNSHKKTSKSISH